MTLLTAWQHWWFKLWSSRGKSNKTQVISCQEKLVGLQGSWRWTKALIISTVLHASSVSMSPDNFSVMDGTVHTSCRYKYSQKEEDCIAKPLICFCPVAWIYLQFFFIQTSTGFTVITSNSLNCWMKSKYYYLKQTENYWTKQHICLY